jgi:ATP-dependent helicase HrpB
MVSFGTAGVHRAELAPRAGARPIRLPPLPIDEVLPELARRLAAGPRAILTAPPGAGKTTRVPLALLEAEWLAGRRIVMLEPRRLAARAAAAWMAHLLGETVGGTVGYRVRLDTRVGPSTRIEVVTEGVLTRMLQEDPALDGVGAVIFDEFHERSIHADLGLALVLQSQLLLRPELRVLVMSATLDADAVAALLDDAPVVRSEGRAWPVETHYLARRPEGHTEGIVAASVARAVASHDGDVLVFLPGAAEIRRTAARLAEAALPPGAEVLPLYGDLPQDAQERAIAPSPAGRRKVVLATAIAETSLTIEGVRVVVDSGLMRVPRFSPRTGMTRLETVPVSRAAADQRRGRAGRLGPGACFRLWAESDDAALLAHRPPEILEADLAPLALELAAWGAAEPAELRWLDPPPPAAYAQARELLAELEALDGDGRITLHGRRMATLPMHPRLAHMLLRGARIGAQRLAAELAALLSERDVLRARDGTPDPDIRVRLALLRDSATVPHGHTVDRHLLRRAHAEARHWLRRLGALPPSRQEAPEGPDDDDAAGLLLALAYPDRIGQRRGGRGRFLLRNGRGASVDPQHNLAGEDWIVAADVAGHGRDSRVFLGAALAQEDLERHFAAQLATDREVRWDTGAGTVRARAVTRLGALVLGERPLADVHPGEVAAALLAAVRSEGLELLPWTDAARRLRERLAFLHTVSPGEWPDVSDPALMESLERWLPAWLPAHGGSLRDVDMASVLLALAGSGRRPELDRLAPTHIEVPSGSRVPVDYADPSAPALAVRLQELFGLAETPRVGGGRVPLTLHLLSPARRPVQVTRDLASFWRSGYFEVRKDLRGRYPKHYWPDDPLVAEPTSRVRPRR